MEVSFFMIFNFNEGETTNFKVATASASDVINGKTFYAGDNKLKTGNFNLGLANAGVGDVLSGKKFYSGNNTLKTGTFNLATANATASDVISGKTFYSGNNTLKTGTFNLSLATATASDVASGKTFYAGNNTLKTGTLEKFIFISSTNFVTGRDNEKYYYPTGAKYIKMIASNGNYIWITIPQVSQYTGSSYSTQGYFYAVDAMIQFTVYPTSYILIMDSSGSNYIWDSGKLNRLEFYR